jgi:hypothetical protein
LCAEKRGRVFVIPISSLRARSRGSVVIAVDRCRRDHVIAVVVFVRRLTASSVVSRRRRVPRDKASLPASLYLFWKALHAASLVLYHSALLDFGIRQVHTERKKNRHGSIQ